MDTKYLFWSLVFREQRMLGSILHFILRNSENIFVQSEGNDTTATADNDIK